MNVAVNVVTCHGWVSFKLICRPGLLIYNYGIVIVVEAAGREPSRLPPECQKALTQPFHRLLASHCCCLKQNRRFTRVKCGKA